jgi:hypothetical protein
MSNVQQQITENLTETFHPVHLEIINESHKHNVYVDWSGKSHTEVFGLSFSEHPLTKLLLPPSSCVLIAQTCEF